MYSNACEFYMQNNISKNIASNFHAYTQCLHTSIFVSTSESRRKTHFKDRKIIRQLKNLWLAVTHHMKPLNNRNNRWTSKLWSIYIRLNRERWIVHHRKHLNSVFHCHRYRHDDSRICLICEEKARDAQYMLFQCYANFKRTCIELGRCLCTQRRHICLQLSSEARIAGLCVCCNHSHNL